MYEFRSSSLLSSLSRYISKKMTLPLSATIFVIISFHFAYYVIVMVLACLGLVVQRNTVPMMVLNMWIERMFLEVLHHWRLLQRQQHLHYRCCSWLFSLSFETRAIRFIRTSSPCFAPGAASTRSPVITPRYSGEAASEIR